MAIEVHSRSLLMRLEISCGEPMTIEGAVGLVEAPTDMVGINEGTRKRISEMNTPMYK